MTSATHDSFVFVYSSYINIERWFISSDLAPLVVSIPPHDNEAAIVAKDKRFLMLEEIISRNEKARFDFSKLPKEDPEAMEFEMDADTLAEFRAKFKISAHIDVVLAGRDVVQIHRLGYCVFYIYTFYVSYSFPLPSGGEIMPLLRHLPGLVFSLYLQVHPYANEVHRIGWPRNLSPPPDAPLCAQFP